MRLLHGLTSKTHCIISNRNLKQTSGNAFTPRPRANISLKGVVFNIFLKGIVLILVFSESVKPPPSQLSNS